MQRLNINKIKLVIIPLDGTIFDLNRYRYNYYHHLCNNKKIELDKQEFYYHLSNMYDMYKHLPLSSKVDTGPLNAKIERELSQYLNYKGIKPKEGFSELIEYLKQKNIKIAVISTHRTKDAVNYLQLANVYNKVHFIIGSDTISLPLPSTQMLTTTQEHFHVANDEVLVISSFLLLNKAASQLNFNTIFCEDLVPAGIQEKETSCKVVNNLFEVLNTLLFDKYEEAEIYSPILGMNANMNKEQLDSTYSKLQETYKNDSQLLDLVDQTYQYNISQLNEHTVNEEPHISIPTPSKKRFTFDELEPELQKIEIVKPKEDCIIEEKPEEEIKEIKEVKEEKIESLNSNEQDALTALLQQINKKEPEESTIKKVTDYDEIENIVKESHKEEKTSSQSPLVLFFGNLLYICAISFLILFVGIIIYIALIHQFETQEGIFGIIVQIFNSYYSFIEAIFKFIFNSLHSIISFIPTYTNYETNNVLLSTDGVRLFNLFIFHSIIIGIVKIILFMIHRGSHDENYD